MKKIILILLLFVSAVSPAQMKEKDYLVYKLQVQDAGAGFAKWNEFTIENTQFLSKEAYRKIPYVQKQFSYNGVFNEQEWDRFYSLLSEEWDRFCNYSYNACMKIETWKLAPNGTRPFSMPSNIKIIKCHGCTFWKIIY